MATREQVARAARALFAERGYVATTIAGIADAADIPAPTIYSAFGSKLKILEEILRLWIADSQVQQQSQEALTHPDHRQRLRMAAHWNRRQLELGYDIIAIYQEAARADPKMAEEWHRIEAARERAIKQLINSLGKRLRVSRSIALDRYLACTQPEVYRTLVLERGWPVERYEAWLADLLVDQLLATEPVG
jgi:AcrR family transcriptional regulator